MLCNKETQRNVADLCPHCACWIACSILFHSRNVQNTNMPSKWSFGVIFDRSVLKPFHKSWTMEIIQVWWLHWATQQETIKPHLKHKKNRYPLPRKSDVFDKNITPKLFDVTWRMFPCPVKIYADVFSDYFYGFTLDDCSFVNKKRTQTIHMTHFPLGVPIHLNWISITFWPPYGL